MRLIIEKDCIKREIEGSFRVCASKADLLSISAQLQTIAEDSFSYGWVTIYADVPRTEANNPPRPWGALP